MKVLHLKIDGRVPSKKNSRKSVGRFTVASDQYRNWASAAGAQIMQHKGKMLDKVEIQMQFYFPDNRRADLDNKVTSVLDLLKDMQIIKDDSWQCVPAFHAQSMGVDKKNARVLIWIMLI